jgi:hypothetical protein
MNEKKKMNLVSRFNELYPIGRSFMWRPSPGSPYRKMTVRYRAYLANGNPVVFAKEKAGYISIDPQFVDYAWREEVWSPEPGELPVPNFSVQRLRAGMNV